MQPAEARPAPETRPPAIELRYVIDTVSHWQGQSACDAFNVAYKDASGALGTAAGGVERNNPRPSIFPTTVCSVALDASWEDLWLIDAGQPPNSTAATIWENGTDSGVRVALPGPHKLGRRHTSAHGQPELLIATLGDSGCRGAQKGQDCSSDWPFQQITQSAASSSPDLFIHVGDYRYYEQWDDANRWNYWLKDFLIPAREALLAAPWALARGNHEECGDSASGEGFTYLFGVGGADCSITIEPSWSFDVAPGGFDSAGKATATHRFVMIDTSTEWNPALKQAFIDAIDLSASESVWWVSHIAPVHLVKFGGSPQSNPGVLSLLDKAVAEKGPLCATDTGGTTTCKPSQMLLGHDHMFQTVTFAKADGSFFWPRAYIVGHGGVDLRGAGLKASSCTFDSFDLPGLSGKQTGTVQSRSEHGYVLWTRSVDTIGEPAGWVANPRDKDGNPLSAFGQPTPSCL
ncbi:metallophosphoesterase [Parerythrobacter lacustris]|uniref:metallophosphoesterase n=1 Tax=Parerythrobacter lacustris TaxID=2969984 RepID=UPI00214AA952